MRGQCFEPFEVKKSCDEIVTSGITSFYSIEIHKTHFGNSRTFRLICLGARLMNQLLPTLGSDFTTELVRKESGESEAEAIMVENVLVQLRSKKGLPAMSDKELAGMDGCSSDLMLISRAESFMVSQVSIA